MAPEFRCGSEARLERAQTESFYAPDADGAWTPPEFASFAAGATVMIELFQFILKFNEHLDRMAGEFGATGEGVDQDVATGLPCLSV